MRELESVTWWRVSGFSIHLSFFKPLVYVNFHNPANVILKGMAIRAGFRFSAFVVEYRARGPFAIITKIYAADFPFSFAPGPRIVTMRAVILQASSYAEHQRRRCVVVQISVRLGRADYPRRGIISQLQIATLRMVGLDFSNGHTLFGA